MPSPDAFIFLCSACKGEVRSRLSLRGQSIQCLQCGKHQTIPWTGIARAAPPAPQTTPPMMCTACYSVKPPVFHDPGDTTTQVLLLLCGVLPGLVYAIWRHTAAGLRCAACAGTSLIPADSPRAQALLEKPR